MIVCMKVIAKFTYILLTLILVGCTTSPPASLPTPPLTVEGNQLPTEIVIPMPTQTLTALPEFDLSPKEEVEDMTESIFVDVLSVNVTGERNAYQFAVEVSSPDTGCDQYADWWEVLSVEGRLLYRRVLLHSHVDEQPFTRSGGPIPIEQDTLVFVRAHMNTAGYGGQVLKGSITIGFESVEVDEGFAADVESMPPLPEGCAF